MRPARSALFLLSSAMLLTGANALASQCVYRGKTDEARVVRFSGEVLNPETWTADAQCERLEVASGVVRVMTQGADGKLGETEVSSGPLLKPEQGMGNKLLRQIRLVLAGDERSRTGMSRAGADFDMLAEAMPTGLLVDRGAALTIGLPDPDGMRGAVLVLTPDTGAPVRIAARANALQIPAAALRAPAHYRWHFTAGAGQKSLDGEFSVVTPATFAIAQDEVKATTASGDGAATLATASGLIARGYVQEARADLARYFLK